MEKIFLLAGLLTIAACNGEMLIPAPPVPPSPSQMLDPELCTALDGNIKNLNAWIEWADLTGATNEPAIKQEIANVKSMIKELRTEAANRGLKCGV